MDNLSILSANVRGFRTNLGDLTHSFVLPLKPDIIATVETFLNSTVPDNYGKISGYTKWHRNDRTNGTKGGIAVCFKNTLQVQPLEVEMPNHLELSFFRLWANSHEALLLCVCYRPQWQGPEPLIFLQDNLDSLLLQFSCKNTIIVGDLNQHLVARAYDDLLDIYGLANHVDFPRHTYQGHHSILSSLTSSKVLSSVAPRGLLARPTTLPFTPCSTLRPCGRKLLLAQHGSGTEVIGMVYVLPWTE